MQQSVNVLCRPMTVIHSSRQQSYVNHAKVSDSDMTVNNSLMTVGSDMAVRHSHMTVGNSDARASDSDIAVGSSQ